MIKVTNLPGKQSLIDQAKAEIAEEFDKKAIAKLKSKLRELGSAQLIVNTLQEEIKILEEKIKLGDVDGL